MANLLVVFVDLFGLCLEMSLCFVVIEDIEKCDSSKSWQETKDDLQVVLREFEGW